MWKNGQMVAITIVIAALYMTALIPFSGLVIVPGFSTVRPANVLPVVFSLLVGPAAAWGAAIGNLLSDAFSGTLTQGSVFGFVGNFFFGFVGYKLWGNLGVFSSGEEPSMRSVRQLIEYLLIALVAATGTGAIIGWGLDLLGLFPFSVFATIVTVNDFLVAAILGPPLLYFLYIPASRWAAFATQTSWTTICPIGRPHTDGAPPRASRWSQSRGSSPVSSSVPSSKEFPSAVSRPTSPPGPVARRSRPLSVRSRSSSSVGLARFRTNASRISVGNDSLQRAYPLKRHNDTASLRVATVSSSRERLESVQNIVYVSNSP